MGDKVYVTLGACPRCGHTETTIIEDKNFSATFPAMCPKHGMQRFLIITTVRRDKEGAQ